MKQRGHGSTDQSKQGVCARVVWTLACLSCRMPNKQTQLYAALLLYYKRIDAYAAFQCPPRHTNIPMPNV